MRIAAFNVENLFDRAKALNEPDAAVRQSVLDHVAELARLFEKASYDAADKAAMLTHLDDLGVLGQDEGPFVRLRRLRGSLIRRPRSGARPEIVASGRADWVGWIEHKTASVNETAMFNTGRVIRDAKADILAVVEAESRVTLQRFTDAVIAKVGAETGDPRSPYAETMLIDGNDDRGIDVGLLAGAGYRIETVASHIRDRMPDGSALFSRDCPVYRVSTPGGARLCVLPNHFKSKLGGDPPRARERRRAQAARVANLYRGLVAGGEDHVVVLGDLNDTPESDALAPLLKETDLVEIGGHPAFDVGPFPGRGTFGLGNDGDKIDYILLSPALFARARGGGLFRKGAWPGSRPARWPVYEQLTKPLHAASDHHLIYADIDLP